ncbi:MULTISPECIES: type III-B CRISPR-associated protein Cas10/Cmr2 [unclassified Bradyrhizobium]|uniref:type III-B CRISPR-associated protein Cas10/Cmr2 n=1 Tax=unclassified Bradyrhizobium TaxID=2631580 RepID=UPI0028E992CF|nr:MULTISPECIES: type III-B CRISPR-associated protein Cas10/Cmr2 [unclassified Bradyrhizobium]
MDDFAFWQQKLIQFFHDPPAKPFAGTPRTGRHTKVAQNLFDAFQRHNEGRKWRPYFRAADWAAAGADRPLLYVPRQPGVGGLGAVRWPKAPVITHPLSPNFRMELPLDRASAESADPFEDEDGQPRDLFEEETAVVEQLAATIPDWTRTDMLQRGFVTLWRRFRDELARPEQDRPSDPLWLEMPADSRCPDHSIWDHLKITTALAFLRHHKLDEAVGDEGERAPWMLRIALGPVSQFIGQSRTSRDLWISSYILSDLVWHAMQTVVTRYGPDCIVYPDLCANPRADSWLFDAFPEALPRDLNPATFAAVLPQAFVALVPRGGAGHLITIEALAEEAKAAVANRWRQLADVVEEWLASTVRLPGMSWRRIWKRQHARCPIHVTWVAVPWSPMERIDDPASLSDRALPASSKPAPTSSDDQRAIEQRRRRLAPWMPVETWAHYELARTVFARSRLDFLQMERGFDYALTHHQLRIRHALRLASDPTPFVDDEPGEKCTLCGMREALHDDDGAGDRLGSRRHGTRKLWSNPKLDPDETGSERLCAVCSVKRFLVKADDEALFNRLWSGPTNPGEARDRDNAFRVPFPSTATIAAQRYIADIVTSGRYEAEIGNVVRACRAAGLPQTSFPRALPQLAALINGRGAIIREFLEYEAQDVLFPETADAKKRAREARKLATSGYRELKAAVERLRKATSDANEGKPNKRIAVIRLDGDNMGELLLGSADSIAARWRDVLHPEVIRRLMDPAKNAYLRGAGWTDLLDCKRLTGPALHAFISRALGHFSHRIVPWVVEREFSGRLVYAGGDDVLCIAPADEAVDLAARLQQLFSAAWIVDTDPHEDPWTWRRRDWDGHYDQDKARTRFRIPMPGESGEDGSIRLGWSEQRVEPHVCDPHRGDVAKPKMELTGDLLPMLGSGVSLSAGISIGHYKTPLSVQLQRSHSLLKFAKSSGRSRVGIGHGSRGGEKTLFALRWTPADRPPAHDLIGTVTRGFRDGTLPGRLPYKLRLVAESLRCGLERIVEAGGDAAHQAERRTRLIEGLFRASIDEGPKDVQEAALALWREGIELHGRDSEGDAEERYTDGLLLCRELARDAAEEEQEA